MTSFARAVFRLEFDGALFCGWQMQDAGLEAQAKPSLQRTFESALATVLHLKKGPTVVGCGRTDAGVHALEFFAHADLPSPDGGGPERLEKIRHSLNAVLPGPVAVTKAFWASPGFDAIRSVTRKTYEYRLLLRRCKPALDLGRVYWLPLDPAREDGFAREPVRDLLRSLAGTHDFRAFAAANHTAKTTVREILRAELLEGAYGTDASAGHLLRFQFEGRGFLKQMVRNLVGNLVDVATGRRSADGFRELLTNPESLRKDAGLCAPPEGLFLTQVNYDESGAPGGPTP